MNLRALIARRAFLSALFLVATATLGCGPASGSEGGTCVFNGLSLNSGPTCNDGLVCDRSDNQCKRAGSAQSGAPCFGAGDPLCATDLTCMYELGDASAGWFCRPPIAAGADCPLRDGVCGTGYTCVRNGQSDGGTCTANGAGPSLDAGAPESDAAAGD